MPSYQITLTNDHATRSMVANRTVFVQIDHATLVTAGRSREDGSDLAVTYGVPCSGGSTYRLITWVEDANTDHTRVYFSLQETLAPSASDDNYYLQIGNFDRHPGHPSTNLHRWLSQIPTWKQDGYRNDPVKQPFQFFDSFTHLYTGSAWRAYTDFEALGPYSYERPGAEDRVRATSPYYFRMPITGTAQISMIKGMRESTWEAADLRIRCDYLIQPMGVGQTVEPNSGLVVLGQSGESEPFGYLAGLWGDYGTVALVERADDSSPNNVLDSASFAIQPNTWYHMELSAFQSGGNLYLRFKIWDPSDPTTSATLSADVAVPAFTTGLAGMWKEGSFAGGGANPGAHIDNLALELYDGVEDADYTASVTISSPAFPTTIGLEAEEELGLGIATTPYPEFITPHGATLQFIDTDIARIRWNHLSPSEMTDLRAFFVSQLGGASKFTATIANVGTGNYKIVPGSFSYTRNSANSFSASIAVRKIW